jgi:tetratricopeptide (TPR) repeat protein
MRKAWITALAVVLVVSAAGCSKKTKINSYVLPGGNVGGSEAKGIAPVQNVVVWPLYNVAAGSKAKGVEMILTDYLIDTLYLKDTFRSVYILNDSEAKDLLARAGEELGLKKKPKEPTQSALVSTKIGQLTGSEAILIGRIDDYDEVKVDKSTYTGVSLSFFLYDGREQSYPTLDSFTPSRSLWRTNAFRSSKETPFQPRVSLYKTSRQLIEQVADRLERDMARGSVEMRKRRQKKIDGLTKQAAQQRRDGEFDSALGTVNEILQLDPENASAKAAIDLINTEKAAALEKVDKEKVANEIAILKKTAVEMEQGGNVEGAYEKWAQVVELDGGDNEAKAKMTELGEVVEAERAVKLEQDKAKNLHLAQQALSDSKYSEAVAAAKQVLAAEPGNEKAQQIMETAEQKIAEAKAAEKESAPPAPAPEPAKAEAPAASGGDVDVEGLRNEAMELFNSEEYDKAEVAWKKLLEIDPEDKQAQEMLETTQMLIEALQ